MNKFSRRSFMNKRFIMIGLTIGMLVFASLACEASVSTATISSATLTADPASGAETTVFTPDQTFYYIVELANAPDTTKVKAVWYAVDDAGAATQLAEKEVVGSGSPITFNASNSNLWPAGNYKVELYLNDKLDRTQEFAVEE
jgi:hypothetical protein